MALKVNPAYGTPIIAIGGLPGLGTGEAASGEILILKIPDVLWLPSGLESETVMRIL